MATDFTQESVLRFVVNNGGKEKIPCASRRHRHDPRARATERTRLYTSGERRSSGSGQSFEQPWESKATREATELEHNSVYNAKLRQLGEADGCDQPFTAPAYYEHGLCTQPSAVSCIHSSPCLLDRPVSPHIHSQAYTHAGLSRSNDSLLRPNGGFNGFPIQEQDEYELQMHGLPEDGPPVHASAMYLQLHEPSSLYSSRDSISIPSPSSTPPDTGWPQDFRHEEQSSDQGLGGQDGNDVRAFLRRTQEARMLSQLHEPSRNISSLHHSTGHLDDGDSRASTRSNSPETRYGPIARRLTSRLRSRMCRSLGEDLDQSFPEDIISSRHNRLQLLSSTISMGNLVSASSSRGHSSISSPAGSTQSLHDGSFNSKHSPVPLDSREHNWFVKAASGSWTEIYALLREDPNLLSKRDFLSGFTVVHWIVKHGDHRA
ncbi:ankyrin repeat domain-containing protein SOWAHC [Pimephales promelas]|nr:ankyrin repeat domain-containing protein SOWAHC [Pimephales promelas]